MSSRQSTRALKSAADALKFRSIGSTPNRTGAPIRLQRTITQIAWGVTLLKPSPRRAATPGSGTLHGRKIHERYANRGPE